jgi:low temperature requirement protein LtrA
MAEPQPAGDFRVSTLELFFDLVFVFVITQLAETLYEHLTLATLGNIALILAVVWWMYSGYAWLTNAIAPNSTTRRTLLLIGMAGFLLMAIATPEAFGEYGRLFGVSYLAVNVVHAILFQRASQGARRAMRVITPLNILAALLVLTGGFLPEPWRHVCWIAAPLVQIVAGHSNKAELHSIAAGHFAERNGLVVIVAIGESIVAIGLGFTGVHFGLGEILVALLGLTIAYYLYWFYFAGDDDRAEHVLARASQAERTRLALYGYAYPIYAMLLGIVVLSVGIHKVVGHPFESQHWGEAIALAGGVALYLAGHGTFLRIFGLRGVWFRFGTAALVLATIPLGHLSAIAQLVAIPVIMVAAAITEDLPEIRRSGSTAIGDFGRSGS